MSAANKENKLVKLIERIEALEEVNEETLRTLNDLSEETRNELDDIYIALSETRSIITLSNPVLFYLHLP